MAASRVVRRILSVSDECDRFRTWKRETELQPLQGTGINLDDLHDNHENCEED